jgi:acetylornithine deacetylase/succinyl-diaminopimelate desuccinylase-like protein
MNGWQIEMERRLQMLEGKLSGQKPLTFTAPECNIPCNAGEEVLREKIERLAAYFEKHARDNRKRSDRLDLTMSTTLMPTRDAERAERSSYYLSGKSDAYARAAEKVREVLGEPEYPEMFGGEPKPAEKWTIDMRAKGYPNDPWGPSGDYDVYGTFPSKEEAEKAIAGNKAQLVERRARRID